MSYDTYTTIPALAQPKVSRSMDHGKHADASGGSKLVGALMKSMDKKKMKKKMKGKHMMPGGKMMMDSEMKSEY